LIHFYKRIATRDVRMFQDPGLAAGNE